MSRSVAMSTRSDERRFLSLVRANRWNTMILERMPRLGLRDWWLTAGCLAQSVWNGLYGLAADHGIVDYDVFYFDADTAWETEDAVIARSADLFADLPIDVQVRNQARVPVWYEEKFGVPFGPVTQASDGIDRFPCGTMAIGLKRVDNTFVVRAPFGLEPVLAGRLVPNPVLRIPDVYAAKTRRWTTTWPRLVTLPWPTDPP
jgi:hypothetical protein